jgi:flagellar biosynthesis protein FlhA
MLRELKINIEKLIEKFSLLGYDPILITSATIRIYLYRLIASSFPNVTVLSYTELPSQIEIEFIDNLELPNAN